ncbi:capsular biosynthesis protein [Cupriavidus sp. 2TAF22]|uniref:capsular polysaccharide export protein, LipB/KpsS family n=1 Tax=unclassified Cupriavidus TaxID=2640874 RepID=UPI003F92364C
MIAIIVDSLERVQFFKRLVLPLSDRYGFIFLTSEPIAHLRIRAAKQRSFYFRRSCGEARYLREDDVLTSIEHLNDDLPFQQLMQDYSIIYGKTRELFEKLGVVKCAMWNGQQMLGRAATRVCQEMDIDTVFLEISNLPDKLFSDSEGVNALSSISRDPSLLDVLPDADLEDHRRWFKKYEEYKRLPPPQSNVRVAAKIASGLNYLAKLGTNGVLQRKVKGLRLRSAASVTAANENMDVERLKETEYIFLPLQVSGDTQLKLHSEVGNVEAIRIAVEKARELGCILLVKPHPAEFNLNEIETIKVMAHQLGFRIVGGNTTILIKYARCVMTINSTIGLEAHLYGKSVICLGRSYYRDFDEVQVRKFVHRYLVDGIDYFSRMPISRTAAARALQISAD